jgi:hypothetical protein
MPSGRNLAGASSRQEPLSRSCWPLDPGAFWRGAAQSCALSVTCTHRSTIAAPRHWSTSRLPHSLCSDRSSTTTSPPDHPSFPGTRPSAPNFCPASPAVRVLHWPLVAVPHAMSCASARPPLLSPGGRAYIRPPYLLSTLVATVFLSTVSRHRRSSVSECHRAPSLGCLTAPCPPRASPAGAPR